MHSLFLRPFDHSANWYQGILNKNLSKHILTEENTKRRIDFLIKELQEMTGVSDSEMDEFKKIIDLADFSLDKD